LVVTATAVAVGFGGLAGPPAVAGAAGVEPASGTDDPWADFATSVSSSCGIRPDHSLWCWGANYAGQVGDGTTTLRLRPVRVRADVDWASVAVGSMHACAIDTSRTLWCWGDNALGQLGEPSRTRTTPAQIGSDLAWAGVSAGGMHTCATTVAGSLWCWGDDRSRELGDPAIGTVFHRAGE